MLLFSDKNFTLWAKGRPPVIFKSLYRWIQLSCEIRDLGKKDKHVLTVKRWSGRWRQIFREDDWKNTDKNKFNEIVIFCVETISNPFKNYLYLPPSKI